jgi:Tfp pilus assembly pilus retraction ATPase PilT
VSFDRRPSLQTPARTRLALPTDRARALWPGIAQAQNADIVALSAVLNGEAIAEALCSAGSGRLVIATTDWTDTFSMMDFLLSRPHLRPALATRLHMVVQQRLLYSTEAHASSSGPFNGCRSLCEVLHVTDGMRDVLRSGDPDRQLPALAAADGFTPLADHLRQLVAAGTIDAREAARVLA